MSATLNDIITDGTAKFKVIKFASSNDMDAVQSEIDTKLEKNTQVNNALKVNNHTVASNVPSNAVFTDTTYSVFSGSSPGVAPAPTVEDAYLRSDGTWQIVTKQVTVEPPVQNGNLTYDGTEQTPIWSNYDSLALTLTGVTTAIDAGTYNAVFTPNFGYIWSDGEVGAKTITWTIDKTIISAVPSQSGTLTYSNGNTLSPTWSDYSTSQLEISGETDGTEAGTYTAVFTPKNNYKWSDGSTTSKNVTWTIEKVALTEAQSTFAQSSTLTYSGSAQSPVISGFDNNYHNISGNSQTDAGTYTAIVSLKNNYKWYDGTTTDKSVSWSIDKASCELQLSTGSMSLDSNNLTKAATVTRSGSGTITAESSNTSVATVSISDTTLTISAIGNGTATITVNVAESSNYLSGSASLSVSVQLYSSTLNNNTMADIQAAAQSGQAASLWNIGDTKDLTLNGSWTTVGNTISLSNFKAKATLIGINHNSSKEGNHLLHFLVNKDSSGNQIGFYYSYMNTSSTNVGGWNGCGMRNTTMANFQNSILPSEWRNVLKSCTKYTDNAGGGSKDNPAHASNVTATSEKVFLLSEYEVQGVQSYAANSAEKNYQEQYEYFKNGNSKVHYRHDSPTSANLWWLRSSCVSDSDGFCCVYHNGAAGYYGAHWSYLVVPALTIG